MLARIGIIHVLLVAATAYLASKRGRNPAAWACAALFFPVMPIIILSILPPLPATPAARPDPNLTPVCTNCGTIAAMPSAKYCHECSRPLRP